MAVSKGAPLGSRRPPPQIMQGTSTNFSQIIPQAADARTDHDSALIRRFAGLLEPVDDAGLERLAQQARRLTDQHFGRTVRMFAPVYLSNECINDCAYCGFSRSNPIFRVTLPVAAVVREARHLVERGFRNLLLVAGEHPRFVSEGYLEQCIRALRDWVPSIGIEVGPMETPEYRRMVDAGCEYLVVYQETYDRAVYGEMHTSGPKKHFDWRLDCPQRGHEGGFRRIGIGALFGLAGWRSEAMGLARHLEHLQRVAWTSSFTVSFPRLRPAAGGFQPRTSFTDRDLVQLMAAIRVCFPQVGIVLSTREPAPLRDALAGIAVTHMSAGSHTEPGGYTGACQEDVHLTVRGRRVEVPELQGGERAEGQFDIADHRPPERVAARLRELGLDPVWKDWDPAILPDGGPASGRAETTRKHAAAAG